jgi:hypothetical protein
MILVADRRDAPLDSLDNNPEKASRRPLTGRREVREELRSSAVIVRCTAKTMKLLGARPREAVELRPLGRWVAARVGQELKSEHLPADALGFFEPENAVIARTASRRMLGIMNDMAMHIEYAVHDVGGLVNLDVPGVNRELRRGCTRMAGTTRGHSTSRSNGSG